MAPSLLWTDRQRLGELLRQIADSRSGLSTSHQRETHTRSALAREPAPAHTIAGYQLPTAKSTPLRSPVDSLEDALEHYIERACAQLGAAGAFIADARGLPLATVNTAAVQPVIAAHFEHLLASLSNLVGASPRGELQLHVSTINLALCWATADRSRWFCGFTGPMACADALGAVADQFCEVISSRTSRSLCS